MAGTATFTLNGVEYPLCYSTRVICETEGRYEDKSAFLEDLSNKTSTRVWFLALLMQGGAAYAKQQGLESPVPLSEDEIMDMTTYEDQSAIITAITEAISAGSRRKVEAKPTSKKANAERPSAEK